MYICVCTLYMYIYIDIKAPLKFMQNAGLMYVYMCVFPGKKLLLFRKTLKGGCKPK